MRSRLALLVALLAIFVIPVIALADQLPSMPENYVVDLAGILDSQTESSLNNYLKELEQKTTVQFIVLTVKSLDGLPIENFSLQTAEKWKLGQKGKDNGLLLTVSLNDRKYRFEVGYGLEGTLPDSLVGSIGRGLMVPSFRQGQYGKGITDATLAVIGHIAKAENVTITGLPEIKWQQGRRDSSNLLPGLFFLGLMALYISLFVRKFRNVGPGGIVYWGGGSFGSGSSRGGGGFSGGFGGGGGGGFGGGGASGGW